MDCTRFGNKLNYYRERNDMTEKDLARKLGVTVRMVEKWENSGHQPLPEDVQKDMYQPEMNENNEYSCYPAWVFYIPKQDQAPSKYGVSEIERHCNYIVINAHTGEMKSYIDPASVN